MPLLKKSAKPSNINLTQSHVVFSYVKSRSVSVFETVEIFSVYGLSHAVLCNEYFYFWYFNFILMVLMYLYSSTDFECRPLT